MDQSDYIADARHETPTRRGLMKPVLLELVPLACISSAYILALIVFGPHRRDSASALPFVFAVGFALSGLGWFSVGERGWGWKILGGRLVVVVAALAMATWVIFTSLRYLGCESSRCGSDDTPGAAFVWATATVWIVALLSPVASAVALAFWIRHHPREL